MNWTSHFLQLNPVGRLVFWFFTSLVLVAVFLDSVLDGFFLTSSTSISSTSFSFFELFLDFSFLVLDRVSFFGFSSSSSSISNFSEPLFLLILALISFLVIFFDFISDSFLFSDLLVGGFVDLNPIAH